MEAATTPTIRKCSLCGKEGPADRMYNRPRAHIAETLIVLCSKCAWDARQAGATTHKLQETLERDAEMERRHAIFAKWKQEDEEQRARHNGKRAKR